MIIEVNNLTKKIRDSVVIDSITLRFRSGNIYGIVGKNGSGKTMFLRALAGLIMPTVGEITVDNKILHKDISYPPNIGLVVDKPEFLNHLSGLDNLLFLAAIKKVASTDTIKEYMRMFDLDPASKKPVRKYSQGMKQKIAIIQSIMEDQKLLVLDEAFNALDEKSAETFSNYLLNCKRNDKLIIITSHHKEDILSLCDEIHIIEDGHLKNEPYYRSEIKS